MTNARETMPMADVQKFIKLIRSNIESSIFGQEDLVTECLCCLLSGGHILMTGAPGLAKTTLVRILSRSLGLDFGRVQFTPDLLPSDIIGADILNVDPESGKRHFQFSPGPVFTNLLLADEINRASPRTQSALLEAMQESSCTVGGKRHVLAPPFMVFATQNPFESEGTFPLPEAQMDRFLIHTLVEYPTVEAEEKILKEHVAGKLVGESASESPNFEQVSGANLLSLIESARQINVDDSILELIRDLIRSTRPEDESCPSFFADAIWYGAGPRAGISLISTARSLALLEGEEVVRWRHIKRLVLPVLRHRIRLTSQAGRDQLTVDRVITQIVEHLEEKHKGLVESAH